MKNLTSLNFSVIAQIFNSAMGAYAHSTLWEITYVDFGQIYICNNGAEHVFKQATNPVCEVVADRIKLVSDKGMTFYLSPLTGIEINTPSSIVKKAIKEQI